MKPFDAPDPKLVAALVQEQPLALLISSDGAETHVTPLPLLPAFSADGALTGFEGHLARRNRQVAALRHHADALVLFQGPHAYLPADTVDDPDWVPTWNYAIARFDVTVTFRPDNTREAVDRLTERLEPGGWRAATHVPHRQDGMLARVIAFDAVIRSASAKFKLGQDEREANWQQIVARLGDDPVARWMRKVRAE